MLIKKIVKRGVKDMTFINKFLSEKLNGKSSVEININENVYNKICKRNGRELYYYGCSSNDLRTGLFFNNLEYAFQIGSSLNGKYGAYYKMKIVDIQKTTIENLNNRIAASKLKESTKDLYLDLFKQQEVDMFNPFSMNLKDKKLLDLTQFEIEKEIINKIENAEDEQEEIKITEEQLKINNIDISTLWEDDLIIVDSKKYSVFHIELDYIFVNLI